jgi:outer membrane protein assembly factor BamE
VNLRKKSKPPVFKNHTASSAANLNLTSRMQPNPADKFFAIMLRIGSFVCMMTPHCVQARTQNSCVRLNQSRHTEILPKSTSQTRTLMKNTFKMLALGSTALILSACVNFPYQAPTQQGNLIEQERVDLIREGMSRADIENTVGSPLLKDVFHQDRWDYIYTLQKHFQTAEQRRITIWFVNDKAVKIERDLPVAPQAVK